MYGYDIFHEEQMYPLIKSIQSEKNSHAYIFLGQEGLSRHICAEMAASALVCENTNQAPCSSCSACKMAKAYTHPDIKYIAAPKDRKTIGVDTIREISEDSAIKPFLTKNKVYIIEGDLLTEAAQNAFLKTLEEPPYYAVFIIICSDLQKLLQTVISRSTIINFPTLSKEKIKAYITSHYNNENRIDFLIRYSEGNPGKVDKIISDTAFEALRNISLNNLSFLLSDRELSAYQAADFFEQNKENTTEILNLWTLFLRDILLISEGFTEHIVNTDLKEKLSSYASIYDNRRIAFCIERIVTALQMCERSVNLRAMILNLCFSVKKTD